MPQESLEQTESHARAQKDNNEPNMSVLRRSDAAGLSSYGSSPERSMAGVDVQNRRPASTFKPGVQAAPLRYRRTASGRDSMDMGNDACDGPSHTRTSKSTSLDEPSQFAPRQVSEPQVKRRAPSSLNSHRTSLDKADQVATLSAQVQELRDAQRRHIENANELETRISENEIACGRMIESALEIGRMIELKKKHLAEDRERLSRERLSRDQTMERVDSIMAQIGKIALGAPSEDAR